MVRLKSNMGDAKYWLLFYGLVFTAFGFGVIIEHIIGFNFEYTFLIIGFIMLILGVLWKNEIKTDNTKRIIISDEIKKDFQRNFNQVLDEERRGFFRKKRYGDY